MERESVAGEGGGGRGRAAQTTTTSVNAAADVTRTYARWDDVLDSSSYVLLICPRHTFWVWEPAEPGSFPWGVGSGHLRIVGVCFPSLYLLVGEVSKGPSLLWLSQSVTWDNSAFLLWGMSLLWFGTQRLCPPFCTKQGGLQGRIWLASPLQPCRTDRPG